MRKILSGLIICAAVLTASANTENPYKGQQERDIKALSQADIAGYLSGKGMELAKAAELNHYPGPRHVLDLANKLELTELQRNRSQGLFNKMQTKAINLGNRIVKKEKELDHLFAEGSINADSLDRILLEIGSLQAKLRYVHLSTHLEQKKLLTKQQVRLYDGLRGYNSGSYSGHNHSH